MLQDYANEEENGEMYLVLKRFRGAIKFEGDHYHDEHVEKGKRKRKAICFNS